MDFKIKEGIDENNKESFKTVTNSKEIRLPSFHEKNNEETTKEKFDEMKYCNEVVCENSTINMENKEENMATKVKQHNNIEENEVKKAPLILINDQETQPEKLKKIMTAYQPKQQEEQEDMNPDCRASNGILGTLQNFFKKLQTLAAAIGFMTKKTNNEGKIKLFTRNICNIVVGALRILQQQIRNMSTSIWGKSALPPPPPPPPPPPHPHVAAKLSVIKEEKAKKRAERNRTDQTVPVDPIFSQSNTENLQPLTVPVDPIFSQSNTENLQPLTALRGNHKITIGNSIRNNSKNKDKSGKATVGKSEDGFHNLVLFVNRKTGEKTLETHDFYLELKNSESGMAEVEENQ